MTSPNWKYDVFYDNSKGVCFTSSFKLKEELKETIKTHRARGNNRPIFPVESWVFDSVYDETRNIKRMVIYIRKLKKMDVME